jgi:hypothetical protein
MEVHAHTHTERKKFTHYLWEFLMLFLAVFCGFLAENQREHYVEHKREKQFMVSLVKDLEMDTLALSSVRKFRRHRLRITDSLIIFFSRYSPGPVPVYGYVLARRLGGHQGFYQSSGTPDQLKNSGGLRLIRKRNVVDSIESYDQEIRRLILRDAYESNYGFEQMHILNKVFDGKTLLKIYADTTYFHQQPPDSSLRVKMNEEYIDEYLNGLITFHSLVEANMNLFQEVKDKATRLLSLIKKEYRLE